MDFKKLYDSELLKMEYNSDYKIFCLTFYVGFGQADEKDIEAEVSNIFPFLDEMEIRGMLFDLKNMVFVFFSEFNNWIINTLGYTLWTHRIKYFAYIYPSDTATRLSFELFYKEMMSKEAKLLKQSGKTELMNSQKRQFFNNREEALNWLKTQIEADSK